MLQELAERDLGELDVLVVYLDGIVFGDYHVLAAVGVDATGRKHVLGLREGPSENATVTTGLLEALVERGLQADRRRLFVIDGAKALRSAIGHVFGQASLPGISRGQRSASTLGSTLPTTSRTPSASAGSPASARGPSTCHRLAMGPSTCPPAASTRRAASACGSEGEHPAMQKTTRLLIATLAVVLLFTASAAAQLQPWNADGLDQPIDAANVDAMTRAGDLVVVSRRVDRLLPDRTHEYLAQYLDGVPVHGAGVSRQTRNGETVSLFGRIHESIGITTIPSLSPDDALAGLAQATDASSVDTPDLVVLPLPDATYRLVYRALMSDARLYFVDASDGSIVWSHDVTSTQQAVGVGTGIAGDRKNVSTTRAGGVYQAIDQLRPGAIVTLDMKYRQSRLDSLTDSGPSGVRRWSDSDLAADPDNVWEDNPAAVDAHVHTGWTYDYFAQRHNWYGVDGDNGRILSLVNNGFANAFFAPPPFGPEGRGVFVYGEIDGTSYAVEDVVGHELMHGVTHFSVSQRTGVPYPLGDVYATLGPASFRYSDGRVFTCNTLTVTYRDGAELRPLCRNGRFLLWAGDGGIIHEAFSDIFGHAVEFFHEDRADPLLTGDYVNGEHLPRPGRDAGNPRSVSVVPGVPYPDAWDSMIRFIVATRDGRTFAGGRWSPLAFVDGRFVGLVSADSGGVHHNSTVLSHAFYLAIEGGRNATTGRSVTGVGAANRADVERAFFRAMTDLMPPEASLRDAARAIRQSAVDLFGSGSTTHTAVSRALHAVGL